MGNVLRRTIRGYDTIELESTWGSLGSSSIFVCSRSLSAYTYYEWTRYEEIVIYIFGT